MTKGADAFRSIGEVAALLGVAPHVLRYWETQFPLLKPMKRPDGRRYYRPDDVRLAAGLCVVLRDEGLTIRGAKKLMARDRGAALRDRGAARLEDGPLADDAVVPDLIATNTAPPLPDHADASHPRSRLRKRHAPSPMPLFDGPAQDGPPAAWLADIAAFTARLRHLDPAQAASPRQRDGLIRLRDALQQIC